MATPTLDEYLEANGLPLDNPAVDTVTNLSALYRGADHEGSGGLLIPRRPGELAEALTRGAIRGEITTEVFGDVDMDGVATASVAAGLRANIDQLLAALQPPQHTLGGTYLVRHVHPTEPNRSAQGRLIATDITFLAPTVASIDWDVYVPGGVLRAEVAENAVSGSLSVAGNLAVPNPGSADQDALTVVLTGTATSVRLESKTWDASGDTYLTVAVDLAGGAVTIDTAAKTATQGGSDVHGNVTAGMPGPWDVWLPLLRDTDNTLRIVPTGGNVTVDVTHYPAYS